jgi:hypothetical protein
MLSLRSEYEKDEGELRPQVPRRRLKASVFVQKANRKSFARVTVQSKAMCTNSALRAGGHVKPWLRRAFGWRFESSPPDQNAGSPA